MTEQNTLTLTLEERATIPVERATFWQRFLALLIDNIFLSLVNGCLGFAIGLGSVMISNGPDPGWGPTVSWIIGAAIEAIYFIRAYSTSGQTLGKRALKIKVVSVDGSPLYLSTGINRTVGYVFSSIPFSLGFLWSIWDKEKQAWHDQIAGTFVVPASSTQEQLHSTIESSKVRRKVWRWLLGSGILAILVLVGFFTLVRGRVAEVREMGPWPGPETSPKELVTVDLSHLGLQASQVQDARDTDEWSGGSYEEGAVITYDLGEENIVSVWALRYESGLVASNDFHSIRSYVEQGNCGVSSTAYLGTTGLIRCQFNDATIKMFWNDNWFVQIVALEGSELTPDVLVDEVRDVLADHWKTIAQE